jgi:hypothetical protein
MEHEDFSALTHLAAEPDDHGGFLIEIGRRVTGPGWRVYRWSAGTLAAGLSADGTRIRLGDTEEVGNHVAMDRGELAGLAAVSADWERRRSTFWRFETKRGAFQSPAHHYVSPGAADDQRIEAQMPWHGTDEIVNLPRPQVITPGAELIADIVRKSEDVAPDGALVGVIYGIGELRITGRRAIAEVERGGSRLLIGPGDVPMLREMLAIVDGQTGGLAP